MSVVQVFSSFVMLSLACVFVRDDLSSVEMWFDRGENWCYGLSKDGRVETVAFRQVMWLIMLKSDKDRIYLRSRPSEQHVSPRVRYGTACLLIRYVVGCVSCSVEWGWLPSLWSVFMTFFCELPEPHGAKGTALCGKPQHCKRWPFVRKP
jgi:hypothetical protein